MSSEIVFRKPTTVGALIEALDQFPKSALVNILGMCETREMDIDSVRFGLDDKTVRLLAD